MDIPMWMHQLSWVANYMPVHDPGHNYMVLCDLNVLDEYELFPLFAKMQTAIRLP